MSSEKPSPPPPTLLFEITSAVHPAFAFLAGAQLDVFSPLQEGPLAAEQLANILGISAPKLKPLLYALAAFEFLTVENDRFANTEVANHYLVRDSPRYLGSMHELLTFMWEAELQTSASIRTGIPQAKHNYATASTDELEQLFQGLHPGAIATDALLKRYEFSPYQALLDVGGGSGGLSITIVEKLPHIEATILELPSVTPITQKFVDKSESRDRIQVVARDVVQEYIEGSYDVAIMRAFIQVLGPDEVRQALKYVSEAMRSRVVTSTSPGLS